jgi:hypothetical protein
MATAKDTHALEILKAEGRYVVAPGTTAVDVMNDVGCWLESAQATIDLVIDGISQEGGQIAANPRMVASTLFGVMHQLRMVEAGIVAANHLREGVVQ